MAERRATRGDRILELWRPIAVILAVIVVVNGLVHGLVLKRTGAVSGDRELILAAARERVEAVRAETLELERTSSKLACARSEIARVFNDLLSSKSERMTSIQREVRELARSRGLDPDRITYKATAVKDTNLVRFTITFPLLGDYAVLEDFVRAAEDSTNFLIVESVSFREGSGSKLSLAVELVTYFQAPDAEGLARSLATAGRI